MEQPPNAGLRSVAELTNLAVSKSSRQNLQRVDAGGFHDFEKYSIKHGGGEPRIISTRSPAIVSNFLADISNMTALEMYRTKARNGESVPADPPKLRSIDTLNGYIQGLQMLFVKHGHIGNFIVDPISGKARGNPTEAEEISLVKFRRRYRALLAEMGLINPKQASPLGVEELLSLCKYVSENIILDAEMQALCLVGTNLLLRFDEVSKLRMECITLYQDSPKMKIMLKDKCKNSTYCREYTVEPWGGELAGSLKLDPCFALIRWILIRGDVPGYLFCSITGKDKIIAGKQVDEEVFQTWMRKGLVSCGESLENVASFRLHSIKRGGVKIWKSLGRHDSWIMRRMHSTGFSAYQRYAFNNRGALPTAIPEFCTMEALQRYGAESMTRLFVRISGDSAAELEIAADEEEPETP